MRTIISNVKESTEDFHPVLKYLFRSIFALTIACAVALLIGVLVSGAPEIRY